MGHRLMTIILSNLNRFTIFFTGRFLSKFAVKWISNIQPHLAYVTTLPHLKYAATLPCNLSLMACFVDINVSQASVATYARRDGILDIH